MIFFFFFFFGLEGGLRSKLIFLFPLNSLEIKPRNAVNIRKNLPKLADIYSARAMLLGQNFLPEKTG